MQDCRIDSTGKCCDLTSVCKMATACQLVFPAFLKYSFYFLKFRYCYSSFYFKSSLQLFKYVLWTTIWVNRSCVKKCGVSGRLPTVPENYRNRVLHGEMHGYAMRNPMSFLWNANILAIKNFLSCQRHSLP